MAEKSCKEPTLWLICQDSLLYFFILLTIGDCQDEPRVGLHRQGPCLHDKQPGGTPGSIGSADLPESNPGPRDHLQLDPGKRRLLPSSVLHRSVFGEPRRVADGHGADRPVVDVLHGQGLEAVLLLQVQDPGIKVIKRFYPFSLTLRQNKLGHLFLNF